MLKLIWNKIVDFHKSRLLFALLNISKEDHQKAFDYHFNEAKRISDFIGMIVRFAFVLFAFQYFRLKAPQVDFPKNFVLGLCSFFALGLLFFLGRSILIIALMYETRDLPAHSHGWMKAILLFVSFIIAIALWIGIYDLAVSLIELKKI